MFNKHIAIVGSTGSGKSHTLTTILQKAIEGKNGDFSLNNSHIIIFDIHSEYRTAFPNANHIDISNLVLPYWLLKGEELEEFFLDTEENDHNQRAVLKEAIVYNRRLKFKGDEEDKKKIHFDSPLLFENGQSAIDCGSHWRKFEAGKYAERIPNKINDEIFAVYHDYQRDHTGPYSYFIGCKVDDNTVAPEGMDSLVIQKAEYVKIIAKGIMPDCVANAWRDIWDSNLKRTYRANFEIYDKRSKDWNAAEVEIYVAVN